MEGYFSQSKEFKNSLLEQLAQKVPGVCDGSGRMMDGGKGRGGGQGGGRGTGICPNLGPNQGEPVQDGLDEMAKVDEIVSKLNNLIMGRVVKEWVLSLDDTERQRLGDLADKLMQMSVIDFCEDMLSHGYSNPFQVLGEFLSNEDVQIEELPEGSTEEIIEEPAVQEIEKDEGFQAP